MDNICFYRVKCDCGFIGSWYLGKEKIVNKCIEYMGKPDKVSDGFIIHRDMHYGKYF